jgi:hypothetical protein
MVAIKATVNHATSAEAARVRVLGERDGLHGVTHTGVGSRIL